MNYVLLIIKDRHDMTAITTIKNFETLELCELAKQQIEEGERKNGYRPSVYCIKVKNQ